MGRDGNLAHQLPRCRVLGGGPSGLSLPAAASGPLKIFLSKSDFAFDHPLKGPALRPKTKERPSTTGRALSRRRTSAAIATSSRRPYLASRFRSSRRVSCRPEVIGAFLPAESGHKCGYAAGEARNGWFGSFS